MPLVRGLPDPHPCFFFSQTNAVICMVLSITANSRLSTRRPIVIDYVGSCRNEDVEAGHGVEVGHKVRSADISRIYC